MQSLNKLRMNLTLMNTAVLIGLSVFIAIVLYVTISINLESSVNDSLEVYAAQMAGYMDYLESADRDSTEEAADKQGYQSFTQSMDKDDVAYLVWDEKFEVVEESNSQTLDHQTLKDLIKRYVSERQKEYWVVNYQTVDHDLRICTITLINREGRMETIQTIKNMGNEIGVLNNAVSIMLVVVIVGAAASITCGYFLSGRSLVPIKQNMERQQEFLADASHELRTPIAVIQTNLEVMKACGDETVASQREWLDNAYSETQRMHRIVEDLMFLARADAGEIHGEKALVDMGFLCAEVTERMMGVAMAKRITLRVDVPETPMVVTGDESQLTQLLIILLDNAIKYSESDTLIRISAVVENSCVRILVKDQGIGIAAEEQDKIFQRFYRVNKARSREQGGTGLGLSIAYWIASGHKGTICVESEEGVGTTMVVKLPLAESPAKEDNDERVEV